MMMSRFATALVVLLTFVIPAVGEPSAAEALEAAAAALNMGVEPGGTDPNCPTVNHYIAPMHQNTACDMAAQNTYKATLGRAATKQKLQQSGTHNVPNQATVFCPQTVRPLTASEFQQGFDTAWIVENTAMVPVVLAYMKEQQGGYYLEVSAFNNKISPPNRDPQAILMPGEWKSVMAHEGHVFHVREILRDGAMGQVLMQHRVGMVPVINKYGHEFDCNPADDIAPVIVKDNVEQRDPNYARKMPEPLKPCNVIDVGFRNQVGCPVNGYYTGQYLLKGIAKPRGNATEWRDKMAHTPKSCHEVFEFHLGLNSHASDFMWDWNSNTKYESAYIGQNFVFRLAKDERIVVDSVSLHTTKVIDCPGLKNQVNAVSMSLGEMIKNPILRRQDFLLPSQRMVPPNGTMIRAANASMLVLPSPSLTLKLQAMTSALTPPPRSR